MKRIQAKTFIKEIIKEIVHENSGLGPDFDAAQAHADKTFFKDLPPDEEEEPKMECPKCGESSGSITKNYKSGKFYSWEAKCDSCGHKWNDDNFETPTDDFMTENKNLSWTLIPSPTKEIKTILRSKEGHKLVEFSENTGVWILSDKDDSCYGDSAEHGHLTTGQAVVWANGVL